MYNSVAENVLGTIGTVLWCVQLIPQIVRNYRVKSCVGVPPLMMFLWALSGVPFSIYFIGTDGSIPLRIQPQLFTFFCTISWAQTLYYPPIKMPIKKLVLYVSTFVSISVGLEVGLLLWLRPVYRHGTTWPMLIIGIIATILLALGLIPPYFELAKRKGRVVGINFIFLSMDSAGAVFSMVSIIVGTMDALSMALYAVVLALELGIFTSHAIWALRFRWRAKDPSEDDLEKVETSISHHGEENDKDNKDDEPSSNMEDFTDHYEESQKDMINTTTLQQLKCQNDP